MIQKYLFNQVNDAIMNTDLNKTKRMIVIFIG